VTTVDHNSLVTAFVSKFYKTGIGQSVNDPLHTVTTSPGHFAEIRAFLIKYYGQGTGQKVTEPLDTVVSKDRFGLVTIHGQDYQIIDIGMRMLEPRELFDAQGFPPDYIIDMDCNGKKSAQ
jgi:DNA (cytosine-5)-methyltransferase 1